MDAAEQNWTMLGWPESFFCRHLVKGKSGSLHAHTQTLGRQGGRTGTGARARVLASRCAICHVRRCAPGAALPCPRALRALKTQQWTRGPWGLRASEQKHGVSRGAGLWGRRAQPGWGHPGQHARPQARQDSGSGRVCKPAGSKGIHPDLRGKHPRGPRPMGSLWTELQERKEQVLAAKGKTPPQGQLQSEGSKQGTPAAHSWRCPARGWGTSGAGPQLRSRPPNRPLLSWEREQGHGPAPETARRCVQEQGRPARPRARRTWEKDTMKHTSWMMALLRSSSLDSRRCVGGAHEVSAGGLAVRARRAV